MFSSDLVPALAAGRADAGPGVRFRQGVVVSWNTDTGANVIDVGGTQLSDVPILNTGEAIALKAGHVVGLLASGASYWILGRVTVPGTEQFASSALDFDAVSNYASDFGLGTLDSGALVSTSIPVPSWATEAAVICNVVVSAANPRAVTDYMYVRALVSSQSGPAAVQGFAPWGAAEGGYFATASTALSTTVALTGAPTIFVGCRAWASGGAWSATSSNNAAVNAVAIFRSGN